MAITPDKPPSNPQKNPVGSASVFKPIAPITKHAVDPEPENPENPFVALSPDLTGVDVPPKKGKALPPAIASLLPQNEPLPAVRPKRPISAASKPVNFLLEDVSITIAPEFMPEKPAAPLNTKMDFSLDYKNPEAERLMNSSRNRPKEQLCHKCGKRTQDGILFNGKKGPVCPRCYNPYVHQLISNIFIDRDPEFGLVRAFIALLHFITAWFVPIVPAIIWYALFVRTGFGGFFEDTVVIFTAPTIEGLVFAVLLLTGLFFIPVSIASVSLGNTFGGSLTNISPTRLFPLVKMAMPGYFLTFSVLAVSVAMNLAGIAWCAEEGMGWAANVLAVFLAVGMSSIEMTLIRFLLRGRIKKSDTHNPEELIEKKQPLIFKKRTVVQ